VAVRHRRVVANPVTCAIENSDTQAARDLVTPVQYSSADNSAARRQSRRGIPACSTAFHCTKRAAGTFNSALPQDRPASTGSSCDPDYPRSAARINSTSPLLAALPAAPPVLRILARPKSKRCARQIRRSRTSFRLGPAPSKKIFPRLLLEAYSPPPGAARTQ